jgi:putative two-component system response regulator
MPDLDGFEVLTRLKSTPLLAKIPVILVTANHDIEIEARALELGADDFIPKPLERSVLIHKIRRLLELYRYQGHLESQVKELEDSIIVSFAELIEARDASTGGHVQRTSAYYNLICQELLKQGLFPNEVTKEKIPLLARAAILHDVGKIGISDSVLLKPSKLNNEEYRIMKRHTVIGADILDDMYRRTPTQSYLLYAKTIAWGHHERWDGRGYPSGLKGEEIPPTARIMAVADVYDALVADRIYRTAMSHREAHELIMSGRGTQFDPVVTDIFDRVSSDMAAMRYDIKWDSALQKAFTGGM